MDDLVELPLQAIPEEEAETLAVAASEGGEAALEGVAAVVSAGAEAATAVLEAGATGAAAAAAGADAVAAAGAATAAASQAIPIAGLIIGAAALLVSGVSVLLGFMAKSKRISIMISNDSPVSVFVDRIYMAHGKQTGTFPGNYIPPKDSNGNVTVARLEFSKDNMALIGTMGTIVLMAATGGDPDTIYLGWEVPENGNPRGAIAINPTDTPEEFYNKFDAAPPQIQGTASHNIKAQFAITSEDKDGFATMVLHISPASLSAAWWCWAAALGGAVEPSCA